MYNLTSLRVIIIFSKHGTFFHLFEWSFCIQTNTLCPLSVSATTNLWTSTRPEYNMQFTLLCQATLPSQYTRHLKHHIQNVWIVPEAARLRLQTNTSIVTKMDPETLTSSLTILSPNASHNGDYSCHTILRLPHETLTIGRSNSLPLLLEG